MKHLESTLFEKKKAFLTTNKYFLDYDYFQNHR